MFDVYLEKSLHSF